MPLQSIKLAQKQLDRSKWENARDKNVLVKIVNHLDCGFESRWMLFVVFCLFNAQAHTQTHADTQWVSAILRAQLFRKVFAGVCVSVCAFQKWRGKHDFSLFIFWLMQPATSMERNGDVVCGQCVQLASYRVCVCVYVNLMGANPKWKMAMQQLFVVWLQSRH